MERLSSRSKPRRLGMSNRKSVSADACSCSIRASARANWVLNRRIVILASLGATDCRGAGGRVTRCGTDLRSAMMLLRRFGPLGAVALVFFFMAIPEEEAYRDAPSQDSPFPIPCHALPKSGPILYLRPMFLDS